MKRLSILLILVVIGCGKEAEKTPPEPSPGPVVQTPFGEFAAVKTYLDEINPYIQKVGELQNQVDKTRGSSGQFTSQNLATAIEQATPSLEQALDEFSRISPPPRLASFHADIEQLMNIRLGAYRMTLDGWKQEQRTKDTRWHQEAEAQFQKANDLIVQLNEQMQGINQALERAAAQLQVASP